MGTEDFYRQRSGTWIAEEAQPIYDDEGDVVRWVYIQKPLVKDRPHIFEEEFIEGTVTLRQNSEGETYLQVAKRCKEF